MEDYSGNEVKPEKQRRNIMYMLFGHSGFHTEGGNPSPLAKVSPP